MSSLGGFGNYDVFRLISDVTILTETCNKTAQGLLSVNHFVKQVRLELITLAIYSHYYLSLINLTAFITTDVLKFNHFILIVDGIYVVAENA